MKKSISIVIPMHNEEDYIADTIGTMVSSLRDFAPDYEIIIVDDASTDRSREIVEEFAGGNPRVKLISNKVNKKLGETLRTGFAACGKELIFYIDADMPADIEELRKALRIMEIIKTDIVTAYRFDRTAEGFKRSLYSFGYNMIIRVLFGTRIRDVNFAFKLFKKEVLEALNLTSKGSFIDAEIMIRSKRAGFSFVQFGVDYFARMRGSSELWGIGIIIKILREMLSFRLGHPFRS